MPDKMSNLKRIIRRYDLVYTKNKIETIEQCDPDIRNAFEKCNPSKTFLDVYYINSELDNNWTAFIYLPVPRNVVSNEFDYANVVVTLGVFKSEKQAADAYKFAVARLKDISEGQRDNKVNLDLKVTSLSIEKYQEIDDYIKQVSGVTKEYFESVLRAKQDKKFNTKLDNKDINQFILYDDRMVPYFESAALNLNDLILDTQDDSIQKPLYIEYKSEIMTGIQSQAVFFEGAIISIDNLPKNHSLFKDSVPSANFLYTWLVDKNWNAYINWSIPQKADPFATLIIPLEYRFKLEESAYTAYRLAVKSLKLFFQNGSDYNKKDSITNLLFNDKSYYALKLYEKKHIVNMMKNISDILNMYRISENELKDEPLRKRLKLS